MHVSICKFKLPKYEMYIQIGFSYSSSQGFETFDVKHHNFEIAFYLQSQNNNDNFKQP